MSYYRASMAWGMVYVFVHHIFVSYCNILNSLRVYVNCLLSSNVAPNVQHYGHWIE